MPLLRRHEVRTGNHTALGVQRLKAFSWQWRVWRLGDGAMISTGVSHTRQQALNSAESWRRIDARQFGRDPNDV